MGQRIGQLEDALSLLQASVSSEQHPLLREEYLKIKFSEDTPVEKEDSAEATDLANEYGSLTLEEGGRTRYLGRTGGSESLMGEEDQHSTESESAYSYIPLEIKQLSRFFPFTDSPHNDLRSLNAIIGYLPDNTRARSLCEVYLTQALWSPRLVMRDELIEDILTPVYAYIEFFIHRPGLSLAVEDEAIPPVSPHRLAVLFLVLGIGTLLDSSIPPYSIEAQDFLDLGKACLSLDSILESSELATLQALSLMGYFLSQGGPGYSPEAPWCIKGSPLGVEILLRGGFANHHLDLDTSDPGLRNYTSSRQEDTRAWGSARRESPIPPHEGSQDHRYKLRIVPSERYTLQAHRGATEVSIYIHRPFFLKAIKDHSNDPLRSPYASSFLAAYNGASTVIQLDARVVSQEPCWLSRSWGVFNTLLSAGLIVGLIVSRCPTHSMAQQAFNDLTLLVGMFSSILNTSSRARAAHGALKRLHDKAIRTLNEAHGQEGPHWGPNETRDSGATSDDDLEIFAGRAKARTRNSREVNDHRDASPSISVPSQLAAQCGQDSRPSSGQALRIAFSSPSGEGLSPAHGGDSLASSSLPTAGRPRLSSGFFLQERQDYHQVLHVHDTYHHHDEIERQPRHQSSLEGTFYVGWEGQPPPHEIVHPPTAGSMGGGMNAQWFALMQEEGFIDLNPGNLSTHHQNKCEWTVIIS
ncbi:hypothetical protein PQX77_000576 [Marasmius sp. AFHP31]|nr:hypothetical protein PQX77_000576 [Marasmius sp. AFHP31]